MTPEETKAAAEVMLAWTEGKKDSLIVRPGYEGE